MRATFFSFVASCNVTDISSGMADEQIVFGNIHKLIVSGGFPVLNFLLPASICRSGGEFGGPLPVVLLPPLAVFLCYDLILIVTFDFLVIFILVL